MVWFVVLLHLFCHFFWVVGLIRLITKPKSSVITSQIHIYIKGMAELPCTRCRHVIHLRLAAKLEMQLTISAFCFSAPHMLWRKRGGRREGGNKTRGSYKAAPSIHRLAQHSQTGHTQKKDYASQMCLTELGWGQVIWKHFDFYRLLNAAPTDL